MVDALDSDSNDESYGGSSPSTGRSNFNLLNFYNNFMLI